FSPSYAGEVYSNLRGTWGAGLLAIKSSSRDVHGRSRGRTFTKLEGELECQLNAARASSAQERVANTDVAGGGDLVPAIANFTRVGTSSKSASAGTEVRGWIGNECRQQRTGEVGMVQQIEELGAQLHPYSLTERRVLIKSKVPLLVSGAYQRIASQVPIVTRARHAIRRKT